MRKLTVFALIAIVASLLASTFGSAHHEFFQELTKEEKKLPAWTIHVTDKGKGVGADNDKPLAFHVYDQKKAYGYGFRVIITAKDEKTVSKTTVKQEVFGVGYDWYANKKAWVYSETSSLYKKANSVPIETTIGEARADELRAWWQINGTPNLLPLLTPDLAEVGNRPPVGPIGKVEDIRKMKGFAQFTALEGKSFLYGDYPGNKFDRAPPNGFEFWQYFAFRVTAEFPDKAGMPVTALFYFRVEARRQNGTFVHNQAQLVYPTLPKTWGPP